MRRRLLADDLDGGCNDLCWLAAQLAVNGVDLGRLNHSLLQSAARSDVQIEVRLVEPRRRRPSPTCAAPPAHERYSSPKNITPKFDTSKSNPSSAAVVAPSRPR